jgi:DNA polymerase-3 subunit epsilon
MREIILDTETTGLNPKDGHKIVEIGCIEMVNRVRTGKFFHHYINPKRDMPIEAYNIHGISAEFLKDKPIFEVIAEEFIEFIDGATLIIHNASFDLKFLNHELSLVKLPAINDKLVIDTLLMARKKFPGSPASLDALCKRFNVDLTRRDKHGALLDSELLAEVYIELTGGIQSSLFKEKTVATVQAMDKIQLSHREARDFPVSQEELEEHSKFVDKIKDAIWKRV